MPRKVEDGGAPPGSKFERVECPFCLGKGLLPDPDALRPPPPDDPGPWPCRACDSRGWVYRVETPGARRSST